MLGITESHFTIKRNRIGIIEDPSKDGKDRFVDLTNKRPWIRNENPNMDDPAIPTGQPFDMSLQANTDSLPTVFVHPRDYRTDSVENRKEYAKVFDYKGLNSIPNLRLSPRGGIGGVGIDLNMLFDMKKAWRMEALQKRLLEEEHDKYIERRFTKAIVKRVTGLQPPALDSFMVQYRPSYEFIQGCETDYEFYHYIKEWGRSFSNDWNQTHPQ